MGGLTSIFSPLSGDKPKGTGQKGTNANRDIKGQKKGKIHWNFTFFQIFSSFFLRFRQNFLRYFQKFFNIFFKSRPSIYCVSRGKANMHGIPNCTVYRISIFILVYLENLGNENWARWIEYTVKWSPVNRGFTLQYFILLFFLFFLKFFIITGHSLLP